MPSRLVILLTSLVFSTAGCWGHEDGGDCYNGTCGCPPGAKCHLECSTPPCHATCDGDNPVCDAVCGNGTCTCGSGSHCDFQCQSPPCHVTCAEHSSCSGTCANGQCICGVDSTCVFTCSAPPCHSTCSPGASCVVHCPNGGAGTQACDIVACDEGAPLICPGGMATTCAASCPP